MYEFIQFHLHLHNNINNACEYIKFVRCLYRGKNNQQAAGDQHSNVKLALKFFLTSHSKPDYIGCFKSQYTVVVNIENNCFKFSVNALKWK